MSRLRADGEMIYLEDFVVGDSWGVLEDFGPVDEEDMVAFAKKWDPLKIHTDREFAEKSQFKGLTASSAYIVAIKSLLLQKQEKFPAIIATKTWREHKIHRPVYAGDILTMRLTILEVKPHRVREDAGWLIAQIELLRKNTGEVVLSLIDEALVSKRNVPSKL